MKRIHYLMVLSALAVIGLDQVSKLVVARHLHARETVSVIDGFFNLVHVKNRGMAFGLMNRPDLDIGFLLLIGGSLAAIVLLLLWGARIRQGEIWQALGLSLILGGAFGNLIDRLRFREVTDFLDFYVGSYHWPAFNLADSAITVGVFIVAYIFLFKKKGTNLNVS